MGGAAPHRERFGRLGRTMGAPPDVTQLGLLRRRVRHGFR